MCSDIVWIEDIGVLSSHRLKLHEIHSSDLFLAPEQKEWIFTYYDSSNNVALSFGSNQNGMQMIVDGVSCSIDSIISSSDFTSSMKPFCVLWTSSNGQVSVHFNGNYFTKTCSSSMGHSVPTGGQFRLGGKFYQFNVDWMSSDTLLKGYLTLKYIWKREASHQHVCAASKTVWKIKPRLKVIKSLLDV